MYLFLILLYFEFFKKCRFDRGNAENGGYSTNLDQKNGWK